MKNKLFFVLIVTVMCGALLFTGCFSVPETNNPMITYQNWGVFGDVDKNPYHQNWGTFGEMTLVPMKDFEAVGLVFTEAQFRVDSKKGVFGNVFTYQALLKEAEKLEADAIINVTIDRRIENVTMEKVTFRQETWYGSALAIKYTNTILQENTDFNAPRQFATVGGFAFDVE